MEHGDAVEWADFGRPIRDIMMGHFLCPACKTLVPERDKMIYATVDPMSIDVECVGVCVKCHETAQAERKKHELN